MRKQALSRWKQDWPYVIIGDEDVKIGVHYVILSTLSMLYKMHNKMNKKATF